jgi:tripartite-type tricarboxylate transporter receptor subunit TctC
VNRLSAEVQRVLAQVEVRERLEREGAELIAGGPERLGALIASDLNDWRKLIADANLKLD